MGLVIERLQADPWMWAAVRRLETRDPDGAAIFRRGGEGLVWELQQGCEFCLSVESVIRHWEAMDPADRARPQGAKRDPVTASQARRLVYAQFFRPFHWFEVPGTRGAGCLVAGVHVPMINRVLSNLRGNVHQVAAADAFDRAYVLGAIWWAF